MKGVFITGTDTGVGKTVVTATLCKILRQRGVDAVAIKPFATGITHDTHWRDNDPLVLSAAMDFAEEPEVISPVRLAAPVSPYDAVRLTGGSLDIGAILSATQQVASRHEIALIEGVGGVLVPLTDEVTVADFAQQLGVPTIVVARSRVGTVNHTLLTLNALRQANVRCEGVVYMRSSAGEHALDERVGPETACRFGKIACFGLVDRSHELEIAGSLEQHTQALPVNDPTLLGMADHLLSSLK